MDSQLRSAITELLAASEEVESFVTDEFGLRLTDAIDQVNRELRRFDLAELQKKTEAAR
ncbi:MAG TPA: hypothetical protein VN577_20155 [Terriglobales bacterium]|nr:hypothetical protein [Terriglobales bacterium]